MKVLRKLPSSYRDLPDITELNRVCFESRLLSKVQLLPSRLNIIFCPPENNVNFPHHIVTFLSQKRSCYSAQLAETPVSGRIAQMRFMERGHRMNGLANYPISGLRVLRSKREREVKAT